MASGKYSSATSSLPPDFVDHLKSVFDKLDKGNNGYIKISNLEKYWKSHYNLDESVTNSPIIKRLNEIAPANMGLVSFPRLCTGIKEALMQGKTHKNSKGSFFINYHFNEDTSSENRMQVSSEENSGKVDDSHDDNIYVVCYSPPTSPRTSTNHENNVQKSLDYGLQLITKIKSWYSRQKSQIHNYENTDAEKIGDINDMLRNILMTQQNKNKSSDVKSCSHRVDELQILKDRVLKLESEKSLLIRELFQLKSQVKSPASKPCWFGML